MVVAVIVEKNISAPAWLVVEPSKSLHQSYQQFDTIVDLASEGRRDVGEGIETAKSAEVVKFLEAGELLDAIELVEAGELVGFVTLGEKEMLMLEGELEVGQMGMRGPLREVKEVLLEGTGCDWAVGPTVVEKPGNNAGKVEDVALSGTSGHSDAVENTD